MSGLFKAPCTVRKRPEKPYNMNEKAGRHTNCEVQCAASADKTTQEAAEIPVNKLDRKTLDEPYKTLLAYLETGNVSLSKH